MEINGVCGVNVSCTVYGLSMTGMNSENTSLRSQSLTLGLASTAASAWTATAGSTAASTAGATGALVSTPGLAPSAHPQLL